jgi:predicted phosphoribosyltransferase
MRFENREDAGIQLTTLLAEKNIAADCVITIPRGGIPVAMVIAKTLHLPLKLMLVRKLGHPINSEYAIGAVTEKDLLVHNDVFIKEQHPEITALIQKERKRIIEMKIKFDHVIEFRDIKHKNIILVDDGIATGTCIELAIQELRKNGVKTITVATPVCPFNTYQQLKKIADETICCIVAQQFTGISAYYHDFEQLTDERVVSLLHQLNGVPLPK